MYDYINGKFVYKNFDSKGCYAVVETGGIGYLAEVLPRDFDVMPEINSDIKIFTVLIHREDKMSLCGFLKREDRDIFNVLTSVSGVGSKMAITLLNSFKTADLIGFVIDGDYKELTRAKGVGPKLAQKIILELKDKLISYRSGDMTEPRARGGISSSDGQNITDARAVLLSLGYEKSEIDEGISRALKSLPEDVTAEEILKKTLQLLAI